MTLERDRNVDHRLGSSSPSRSRLGASIVLLVVLVAAPAWAGPAGETADTMAEIGVAMASWLTDQVGGTEGGVRTPQPVHRVPSTGDICVPTHSFDVSPIPVISHAGLEALLVPSYLPSLPELDAWGNAYEFRLRTSGGRALLAIRSPGRDGTFEGTTYSGGTTGGPDDDQVWVDGVFARVRPSEHDTARQRRTRFELATVGIAWISWLVDQVSEGSRVPAGTYDLSVLPTITHADLLAELVRPGEVFHYTECLPENDPWGNPYEFRQSANLLASQVLALRSAGRDGAFEGDVYDLGSTPPDDFDRDLVWADGSFVQFPAGDPSLAFSDGFELGDAWPAWSCVVP